MRKPYVVAIGGTLRQLSSTEKALAIALKGAEAAGAEVRLIGGEQLDLPSYSPESDVRSDAAMRLIAELRRADGVILGSPGYHGGISGMVKNALDYIEDMRDDDKPYLDGRAVGCIATGAGWQGANATLVAMRNVVHALRGWNTPIGMAINTVECSFRPDGVFSSPKINEMLGQMGRQVAEFPQAMNRVRAGHATVELLISNDTARAARA